MPRDVVPGGEDLGLGVVHAVAAHLGQGFDLRVHAGDVFVEDEGVGDDGAGHAAGLGYVDHSQAPGDFRIDARPQLLDFIQMLCGALDAFFESGGGLVDCTLGNGHQAHHVGHVFDRALQPAGLREATFVAVLGENAVGEAGGRQRGAQVVGVADGVGVAEGDDRFDDASVGGQLEAEAGFGLRFDGAALACYSASMTTGARPGTVMMMSGRRPGWPEMAWVFSERTWPRGIMSWSRLPRALLALGSVWRGMVVVWPVRGGGKWVGGSRTGYRVWVESRVGLA